MKLQSKDKFLNLTSCKVMGILNVTPDSFSDGGKYAHLDAALSQVESMLENGAEIIDVGGESTRPGAVPVSENQELDRVIPIIEAVRQRFDTWISIDTSKANVMKEAVNAGADLINDVCALQAPNALQTAAELSVPVCLMHMKGEPANMQINPQYENVIEEVDDFFFNRILACKNVGISQDQIILDPGFGFGKTLNNNYQLLMHLAHFHHYELPILAGMSRKSMIYKTLNKKSDDVLGGSLACATMAVLQGIQIIRVHDVKETVDAVRVIHYMESVVERFGVTQ